MIVDAIFGRRSPVRQFSLDAARSNRLNEDHWADASDESINTILAKDLSTIRARAGHEFMNNPMVKGVAKTYVDDIVGPKGPSLAIQTDDDNYNTTLEQIWQEWWALPDLNGVLSGPDVLGVSGFGLWTAGDYLWQIVVDDDARTPIRHRILVINSRRMTTPYDRSGDDSIMLGVERNKTGKPLAYYIEADALGEGLQRYSIEYSRVPAEDMIHGFERLEPEQVRGFPWLQTCLPIVAELRDYDKQVMEAARMAAALAVLLFARNPDAGTMTVNDSTEIESGTMKTLPPGYEATQITPTQPPAIYKEFRSEKLTELGRPVGMPLLTVRLDAAGHSWSSARLDRDVYQSGLRVQQSGINRTGLNRLLDIVRREAELARLIDVRDDYKYVWTWLPFSSIDPLKEAKGATERLFKSRVTTLAYECAALGLDWEDVVKQQKREKEALEAAGLLPAEPEPEEPEKGAEDDDDNEKPKSGA